MAQGGGGSRQVLRQRDKVKEESQCGAGWARGPRTSGRLGSKGSRTFRPGDNTELVLGQVWGPPCPLARLSGTIQAGHLQ